MGIRAFVISPSGANSCGFEVTKTYDSADVGHMRAYVITPGEFGLDVQAYHVVPGTCELIPDTYYRNASGTGFRMGTDSYSRVEPPVLKGTPEQASSLSQKTIPFWKRWLMPWGRF